MDDETKEGRADSTALGSNRAPSTPSVVSRILVRNAKEYHYRQEDDAEDHLQDKPVPPFLLGLFLLEIVARLYIAFHHSNSAPVPIEMVISL